MKSVIFNAEEVRATLEGRKTQFRAVIKPQPKQVSYYGNLKNGGKGYLAADEEKSYPIISPFGKVGDEIFVKESFSIDGISLQGVWYWADGNPEFGDWTKPKLAQHMKQEHSRLFLKIKSVKVERLQDISEEDCWKEGCEEFADYQDKTKVCEMTKILNECIEDPRPHFAVYWNSTHKKPEEKWEANPFCFVYEYEVVR